MGKKIETGSKYSSLTPQKNKRDLPISKRALSKLHQDFLNLVALLENSSCVTEAGAAAL